MFQLIGIIKYYWLQTIKMLKPLFLVINKHLISKLCIDGLSALVIILKLETENVLIKP